MLFTVVKTALLAAPLPYRVCSQGAAPSCTGYACETTWGRTNGKAMLTGVRSNYANAAHCSDVGFLVLGAAVLPGVELESSVRAFQPRASMENATRESSDRTPKTGRSLRSRKPGGQQPTAEPGPLRRLLQGVRQPRAHGTDRARHRATTTPVAPPDEA